MREGVDCCGALEERVEDGVALVVGEGGEVRNGRESGRGGGHVEDGGKEEICGYLWCDEVDKHARSEIADSRGRWWSLGPAGWILSCFWYKVLPIPLRVCAV